MRGLPEELDEDELAQGNTELASSWAEDILGRGYTWGEAIVSFGQRAAALHMRKAGPPRAELPLTLALIQMAQLVLYVA